MAHLRDIRKQCEWTGEANDQPQCHRAATQRLHDQFNEAMAVYCREHADPALQRLQRHEDQAALRRAEANRARLAQQGERSASTTS